MNAGKEPSSDDECARRAAFARALARAIARIDRRSVAIRSDLNKAETARAAAERARLFVASAAAAPRGTRVLVTLDWAGGKPEPIEMPLDPSKGAGEQLAAIFRRARRLATGAATSRERLRKTEVAGDGLRELALALAAEEVDIASLEVRALHIAPRDYGHAAKPATSAS